MAEGQSLHEPILSPEKEVRAAVTPAISHVALTSVEHSFADPDKRDLTEEQKASWISANPDSLQPALDAASEVSWESRHAADKDDTRAFDERNKEWNEGFRDAVSEMMNEEGLDAAVHGERKLAFSALGITLSDDKENGLYKDVEEFRKKYVAADTSDINQFIKDLSYGCDTKDDGIVNLTYLEQRLAAVAPMLVVFGTDKNAHQLVADFAMARGMLTQTEPQKKALADQLQSQMKQKPSTEEHIRLKALHDKMAERETRTTPPTDDAKEQENQENISIKISGESIAGDRGKNQDAIWFDEKNKAAIVCDGLGGHGDGEKAAQSVRDSLKQSLSAVPKFATHVKAQQWLREKILHANTQLGEAKKRADNPIAQDAGTTLSASFVWESPDGKQILITGNLGDSRISVIREDTLIDVTLDQGMILYHLMENPSKPGEYLLDPDGKPMADKTKPRDIQDAIRLQKKFSTIEDPDTLTGEEAALWKIRNRIDASVNGESIEGHLLMGAVELQEGDRILLRSDGLTDVMSDDATLKALKGKNDSKSASSALIQGAIAGDSGKRAKGYSDDKSVVVMDVVKFTVESEGTGKETTPTEPVSEIKEPKSSNENLVMSETSRKAWDILMKDYPEFRDVSVENLPDDAEQNPASGGRYVHPKNDGESPVIYIRKDYEPSFTFMNEKGQAVLDIIASKLNIAPEALTDDMLQTFILLHEAGHAHDYKGITEEQRKAKRDADMATLPAKSLADFMTKNPAATEAEIKDFVTRYRNTTTETAADNFAVAFFQKHPELFTQSHQSEENEAIPQVSWSEEYRTSDGKTYTVINPGGDFPVALRSPDNTVITGKAAENILKRGTKVASEKPHADTSVEDTSGTAVRKSGGEAIQEITKGLSDMFGPLGEMAQKQEVQVNLAQDQLGRKLRSSEMNIITHGATGLEAVQIIEAAVSNRIKQAINALTPHPAGSSIEIPIGGPYEVKKVLEELGRSDSKEAANKAAYDKANELDGVKPTYQLTFLRNPDGESTPFTLKTDVKIEFTKQFTEDEKNALLAQVENARTTATAQPEKSESQVPDDEVERIKWYRANLEPLTTVDVPEFIAKFTDELKGQYVEYIDKNIQGAIAAKTDPDTRYPGTVAGVLGNTAFGMAQRIFAVKENRIPGQDELLRMPFKDFAKKYLDYDVSEDYDKNYS